MERVLIHTPRLELRPIEPGHAPLVFAMLERHRAEMSERVSWAPLVEDPRQAEELCQVWMQRWDVGLQFVFAVHLAAGGAQGPMVGLVMLVQTNPADLVCHSAEMGFLFDPDYGGQGLANEASRTLLRWGFGKGRLHRVHAVAPLEHGRTLRYLLRLGFTIEGQAREAEWVGGRYWTVMRLAMLDREGAIHLQERDDVPRSVAPPPLPSSIGEPLDVLSTGT